MPARRKTEWTLDQLVYLNNQKFNDRARNSKVVGIKKRENFRRFVFLVKSSESYSSKSGHIVSILFPSVNFRKVDPKKIKTKPTEARVKLWCTCPAFWYWGPAYQSEQAEYALKPGTNIQPNMRDPKRENTVCKHVARVHKNLKNWTFNRLVNKFGGVTTSSEFDPTCEDLQMMSYSSIIPVASTILTNQNPKLRPSEITDLVSPIDEDNWEDMLLELGLLVPDL